MPFEVSHAQHIGARAEQQDVVAVRRDLPGFAADALAAVVADGMGGHQGGAEAARRAVDVFLGRLGRTAHAEPAPDVLHRATGEAGRAVVEAARAAGLLDDMGTTLVAAIVEHASLSWVSVGDSAVFLVRNGALQRLNTPHTLGARLDRAVADGRMSPDDAAGYAQRHALTSYLGKATLDEVDGSASPVPFEVGDALVLCSDGLFGTLAEPEIAAIVSSTPTADAARALVEAAMARAVPRQDNVSAVVVRRASAAPPTVPPRVDIPSTSAWRPLAMLGVLALVAAVAFGWWRLRPVPPTPTPAVADSSAAAGARSDTLAASDTLARADSLRRIPAAPDSGRIAMPPDTASRSTVPDPPVPRPSSNVPRLP